ncbi:tetratricopeptide repeat protein [Acidovorax sp. MR-S7]|uniref:tetratricopeptide repeat protein n=1 Tax=Acidovorax sp. MR-S7 TaxID=1268622 RepID=UPI0003A99577|nr:tetratricopeptide repeat protein [Acidovorax sp. MR-S7]
MPNKEKRARYFSYVFALMLILAVLGVYLPGLQNDLLFDDTSLLKNRVIFNTYGNLLEFKQRMVSYGSFVWVEQLAGPGYWKQRLVNVALHLGAVAAMYALLKTLLVHTRFPESIEAQEHFAASRIAAVRVGTALFALHPVAVYAVGYLIQRSILMATLFALLACLAWVRALATQRWLWYLAAVLCYALAVLSKEHAVMTAAIAVPLYIYVRRPGWKNVAAVVGGALLLLAAAAAVLLHFYSGLVGRLFDAQSLAYAQQLEALQPGISQHMYPLSVLNQAALFLAYGLRWIVPYLGWLSIDLRPAFPLSLASPWHIAGAIGYLALFAGAAWLLLRRTGPLSLAGLLVLFPLLWFFTEFATVWVQDPFVLYRSYLWATTLPGLLAILLTGLRPRTIYALGAMAALVLGTLAFERNLSLHNELTAWTDAAEKTDAAAPANAVGRSRPYVNLGNYYLQQQMLDQAQRNLSIAKTFGDRGELGGTALFNSGVILQMKRQDAAALQAFSQAQALGYTSHALHYHRGESLAALGQLATAHQSYSTALSLAEKSTDATKDQLLLMRVRQAEIAMAAQMYDEAIRDFRALWRLNPREPRFVLGLGMAYVGKNDAQAAIKLFDQLIAHNPADAQALYGRALAYRQLGQQAASLRDLDQAIKIHPQNPQYTRMRETFAAQKQ